MTKEERAELYKDSIGYECVEIDDTDDVGELMSWGEVVRDIKNSYIQGATEQEIITKNEMIEKFQEAFFKYMKMPMMVNYTPKDADGLWSYILEEIKK